MSGDDPTPDPDRLARIERPWPSISWPTTPGMPRPRRLAGRVCRPPARAGRAAARRGGPASAGRPAPAVPGAGERRGGSAPGTGGTGPTSRDDRRGRPRIGHAIASAGGATTVRDDGDAPTADGDPKASAPLPGGTTVRYFGDYELIRRAGPRRHGGRLPGPAGQPQPARRPQDDPGRRPGRRRRAAPVPERGRGRRPARPPRHRADLRGRRARRPALLQHEAGRRAAASPTGSAAYRDDPRAAARAAGRGGRGGAPRPPAGHPPPRPQAGQHPARRRRASRTSPTSAWPSGSRATAS